MLLKDFATRIRENDALDFSSTLPEHLREEDLSEDQLAKCGETVYLTDEHGEASGKVSRELLEYLISQRWTVLFSQMLDQLDDGVIAVDAAGRIYYANAAYVRLLGVPLRRVIGRYIQEIEPKSLLCRALAERTPQSSEKQLIPSVHKYVALHAVPLWEGKQLLGAVSVFQDVTELHKLNKEVRKMTDMVDEYSSQLNNLSVIRNMDILTQDKAYLNAIHQASIVARTDVPVLIRGENGCGKELLANYVHQCSDRRSSPLIVVNCAAIPAELLESELFGYEEGAFTGAKKGGKKGKFELADKGTIFLDEIGDMPVLMQSKLLRVIQSGEIEKLGRQKNIRVDTRIIAATNQPIEQLIEEKRFRQDLFFRLNNFTLSIPPLRERPDDILLLTDYFVRIFNEKYHKNVALSAAAYRRLQSRRWPGNVRELQGCIERVIILEDESFLWETENGSRFSGENSSEPPLGNFRTVISACEEQLLRRAIAECGGNKSRAMVLLGLSRRTFYRKCAEYGIR